MDDDRDHREEEERREAEERWEAEERQQTNPRMDMGRRRRDEPLIDYEWLDMGEVRPRRSSQSERSPSEAERDPDRNLDRDLEQDLDQSFERDLERDPDPSLERDLDQEPYQVQRRGLAQDQMRGLYGSQVGSNVLRAAIAECIGTFILVFTGCAVATAAILQRSTAGPGFYDSLAVALAFGLALTAVVAAIGHVSGAHVNPAVTLGLAATNKFPWEHVPAYVGAQLLGAILGGIGTWIAYGSAAREFASVAATFPAEGVGDIQALLVEFMITFILVFVIIAVATDDRIPAGVAPLAVGFALACGVFIAGPVTGGAVNPARALGPMIVAVQFTAVWVYILGPIAGGVLAALLYDRFISEADTPE